MPRSYHTRFGICLRFGFSNISIKLISLCDSEFESATVCVRLMPMEFSRYERRLSHIGRDKVKWVS